MDVSEISPFNDALDDLRISGSVLLHETYAASWAIEIPSENILQQLLGVGTDVRVLPFHLVMQGEFDLEIKSSQLAEKTKDHIIQDDLVICPGGLPHEMSLVSAHMPKPKPVSLTDIIQGNGSALVQEGNVGTELICGVFQLCSMPLNPLLAALPSVMKVKTDGVGANPILTYATKMLALELTDSHSSSFTSSRILEVFCAEAIRTHSQETIDENPGWFKALNDARISKVITHIHQNPGHLWTVALLAEKINMSPSRFAAKFRETTGQTVMSYVARWRMNVACRLLQDSNDSLAIIADKVGYKDVAAFSRAFKDLIGNSPARWRTKNKE